jgi:hypothetical protein
MTAGFSVKNRDHLLAAINSYVGTSVPSLCSTRAQIDAPFYHAEQISSPDEVLRCLEDMAEAAASAPPTDSSHISATLCEAIKRAFRAGTHGRDSKASHGFFESMRFVAGLLAPDTSLGAAARDLADVCLLATDEHPEALSFSGPMLVSACLNFDALNSGRSDTGEQVKREERGIEEWSVGKEIVSAICTEDLTHDDSMTSITRSVLLPNWTAYTQLASAFPFRYVEAILADRMTSDAYRQLREAAVTAEGVTKPVDMTTMNYIICGDLSAVREVLIKEASEVKVVRGEFCRYCARSHDKVEDERRMNRAELYGDVCIPLERAHDLHFEGIPVTNLFERSDPFHHVSHMDTPRGYLDERFWDTFRPQGVVCAGGAALYTMLGLYEPTPTWAGDVDLFLIRDIRSAEENALEVDEMALLIDDITRYLTATSTTCTGYESTFAYVSRNALTLQFASGVTKIQIMTRPFMSIEHVLSSFDSDPCRVAYDGSRYYITHSAALAVAYRTYALQPGVRSTLYRLCKYTARGFACAVAGVTCPYRTPITIGKTTTTLAQKSWRL